MTIHLPRLPKGAVQTPRPIRSGEGLRSALGAPYLPVGSMGDHWAIEIDPGVLAACCGAELIADLLSGTRERIAIRIPQQGDRGPVGAVVVDGDDQSGSLLNVRGLTPQFAVGKGWFLSIRMEGVRFVHMVLAQAVADAAGEASLALWPMLRVPPSDGDAVEIADPWLEGQLMEGGEYETGMFPTIRPAAFVIEEAE